MEENHADDVHLTDSADNRRYPSHGNQTILFYTNVIGGVAAFFSFIQAMVYGTGVIQSDVDIWTYVDLFGYFSLFVIAFVIFRIRRPSNESEFDAIDYVVYIAFTMTSIIFLFSTYIFACRFLLSAEFDAVRRSSSNTVDFDIFYLFPVFMFGSVYLCTIYFTRMMPPIIRRFSGFPVVVFVIWLTWVVVSGGGISGIFVHQIEDMTLSSLFEIATVMITTFLILVFGVFNISYYGKKN